PELLQLAPAPDGAVAVLVGGEILDHADDRLAVPVRRVGIAGVRAARDAERAVGAGVAVEHPAVEVRVRDIAPEHAHRRAARPGVLADLRALEGAGRMLRQREPEADRVGAG